jgi:Fe-S-cluster containining protein
VFLAGEERAAMAAHLGLALDAFDAAYRVQADEDDPARHVIDATDGQGCPLLDAGERCSVHPVKPAQCRTFPFWPELLDDAAAWGATRRYCPGLDAADGRLYSRGEILAIRAGDAST